MTALFSASTARADVRVDDYSPQPGGMIWIPGGTFRMGSDRIIPKKRRRTVSPWTALDGPLSGDEPAIQGVRKGHQARHRRRDHA